MDSLKTRGKTVKRPSVPLTERDLRDLQRIRESPSAQRELGVASDASEATMLHAVLERGLREVREAAEAEAYERYAESLRNDPDEIRIRAALRERRNRRETASS